MNPLAAALLEIVEQLESASKANPARRVLYDAWSRHFRTDLRSFSLMLQASEDDPQTSLGHDLEPAWKH